MCSQFIFFFVSEESRRLRNLYEENLDIKRCAPSNRQHREALNQIPNLCLFKTSDKTNLDVPWQKKNIAPVLRRRNLGAMRRLTARVTRTSEAWRRFLARLTGARTTGEYAETHERPVCTFPPPSFGCVPWLVKRADSQETFDIFERKLCRGEYFVLTHT